jgi:hypothetical protein
LRDFTRVSEDKQYQVAKFFATKSIYAVFTDWKNGADVGKIGS